MSDKLTINVSLVWDEEFKAELQKFIKDTIAEEMKKYPQVTYVPVPSYPSYPIYPYSPVTYEYKLPTTREYTITCVKDKLKKCGVGFGV